MNLFLTGTLEQNPRPSRRSVVPHGLVLCLLLWSAAGYAQKTDAVTLNNGDRLTGELKLLERGKLKFKTDATDTIRIEWDDVIFLISNRNLQVELDDGRRYLGKLAVCDQPKMLRVKMPAATVTLDMRRVVNIMPIEATFWKRIDGYIKAGLNLNKGSDVSQFNLGFEGNYRTELRIISLEVDTNISGSRDNETSSRGKTNVRYTRLRANRWLNGAVVSLEVNDELGLDLRTSIGGGGGRYLRQTNHSSIVMLGALIVSREDVAGVDSSSETLEGSLTTRLEWFRYDEPELDFSTSLEVIPNISDFGRVRAELDIQLRWEFLEDLFWDLSFYESYDSDPPSGTGTKSDYGIYTSLALTF